MRVVAFTVAVGVVVCTGACFNPLCFVMTCAVEAEFEEPTFSTTLTTKSGASPLGTDFGRIIAASRTSSGTTLFGVDHGALVVTRGAFGAGGKVSRLDDVFAVSSTEESAIAIDLDGDGDADLVASDTDTAVVRDDGDRAVNAVDGARLVLDPFGRSPIGVADVDGDGHDDALVVTDDGAAIIAMKDGVVRSVDRQALKPTAFGATWCPVGFDSNAGALLMFAVSCGDFARNRVFVVDVVAGKLALGDSVELVERPERAFSRDGAIDIASERSTVETSLNAAGGFAAPQTVLAVPAFGFADVDGDGHAGFIVDQAIDGAEVVLKDGSFDVIVADVDGDGVVDVLSTSAE